MFTRCLSKYLLKVIVCLLFCLSTAEAQTPVTREVLQSQYAFQVEVPCGIDQAKKAFRLSDNQITAFTVNGNGTGSVSVVGHPVLISQA